MTILLYFSEQTSVVYVPVCPDFPHPHLHSLRVIRAALETQGGPALQKTQNRCHQPSPAPDPPPTFLGTGPTSAACLPPSTAVPSHLPSLLALFPPLHQESSLRRAALVGGAVEGSPRPVSIWKGSWGPLKRDLATTCDGERCHTEYRRLSTWSFMGWLGALQ